MEGMAAGGFEVPPEAVWSIAVSACAIKAGEAVSKLCAEEFPELEEHWTDSFAQNVSSAVLSVAKGADGEQVKLPMVLKPNRPAAMNALVAAILKGVDLATEVDRENIDQRLRGVEAIANSVREFFREMGHIQGSAPTPLAEKESEVPA